MREVKKSALTTGNGALFGHGTKGFARLNYYKNGQCWVEFWEPIGDGSKGKLVYRSPLYSLPVSKKDIIAEKEINYSDSVKVMAVGEQYKASSFKKAIFGEHYRSVWASPIEIPYLDLTKFAGGLTPLQLGGGHQTKSLRLEGKDKIQYQFRTIDKDPSSLLPEGLRLTFADQIAQDQISSAHPFGALIVPDLASAIGVYHTNPQVVYMPYSRLLGPYLQDIGGRAGIIEIRADEDLSQFKDFGYTKNAVGTETMYDKLKEDNDNSVDQKSFLKARLFDMLIGDWDRHEDQWRWAEFNKKGKGILFRPIPRDRDQVFTKFDGIIPSLIKSILPDIQNFDYHIKSPADLSIAARNLDRNLLNQLSYQDWMAVTDSMKVRLTDAVIEKSVKKIPPTAYDLTGKEIIAKLKSRRDELTKTADEYYKVLAKEVTVSGSDKYEYVEINREKDSTNVKMYKTKKDGEIDKIIYSRVFANDLTNELNFYLLGNEDSLVVKGSSTRPIKIRVVGGKDKDYLADEAGNGRTIFYDTPGTKTKDGANTKIVLSKGDWVNEYLPNNFIYDKRGLSPNIDYKNSGDGLLLGLSYNVKHYGFRKDPYSFEQKVSVLHSIKTAALLAKYKGTFYSLFAHKYDLVLAAKYDGSAFDYNYYGLGNSTPNVGDDVNFYRVKSTSISTNVYLQYHITDDVKFGIGPGYDYMKILDRSEANYLGSRNITNIDPEKFVTLKSYLNLAFVDSKVNPKTGFKWDNEVGFYSEINGKKDQHLRLSSIATIYGTPNISFPVTFALRIGAQTNIGDYKFYQANTIGNNTYLRGFRSQRFSGKTAYFANSEFRFKVSSFRNYIFTGDFGVYTFYDIAKIRSNQLESKDWHQGYGPGIWINFYDKILLSLGYGFSNESRVFSFSTGFRF